MANEFDRDELQKWFGEVNCFWCRKWHADCFHHIMGRGRSDNHNDSILNACPINNFDCHINIHSILKKEENQKMLLQKTLQHLLDNGYKFNDNDKMFLYENRDFYLI